MPGGSFNQRQGSQFPAIVAVGNLDSNALRDPAARARKSGELRFADPNNRNGVYTRRRNSFA